METSLTVIEKNELDRLEAIIEKGQQTFIEVGMALTQIKDSHLYRETYKTFEDYCKKRWEFTKRHAYRLIESIKTIENLKSDQLVTPPKSESQIRPLTHLKPEQQREVWQKAVETAPEGKVTARHVQNTVNEIVESKGGKLPQKSAKPLIRKESKNLSQLKFYWQKASTGDRKKFHRWLRGQKD